MCGGLISGAMGVGPGASVGGLAGGVFQKLLAKRKGAATPAQMAVAKPQTAAGPSTYLGR